ncbi:hypothetical protein [Reinekea sp. G2M2-21]|uniref:hypothetical protein n=1 Tax=Reinekea sp. G2M2-21 TaxID=2788942 RepID=UPI0018AB3C3C|nr:hypothetical protein [Reinekea sp. G2M2-21]
MTAQQSFDESFSIFEDRGIQPIVWKHGGMARIRCKGSSFQTEDGHPISVPERSPDRPWLKHHTKVGRDVFTFRALLPYQKKFGVDFDLGIDVFDFPELFDASVDWETPRFAGVRGKKAYVLIVEFPDKETRSDRFSVRYTLYSADARFIDVANQSVLDMPLNDNSLIVQSEKAGFMSAMLGNIFL